MTAKTDTQIMTELVEFAAKTKYPDIPKEVIEFTKGLCLKTVASMVVGSANPAGRAMARLIRDRRLSEEVGVIASGFRTTLWEGVFLNALFAHAAELEDNRFTAGGVVSGGASWDITVIPLVLSLAEKLRLTGKATLEVLAVGLEVHSRSCQFSSDHLGMTIVPGAVGPAVAGAKALGLGAKEIGSALSLATSGVPLSVLNFGTDAHFFESALHSLQAIIAAEMAREGMTGKPDMMIAYLSNMMGKDKVVPEKLVDKLGTQWIFSETWIKKYPCCFLTHRHIDALMDLIKEHNLSYEQVESIEAEVSPVDDKTCNRPEPKTEMDLQFSFQNVLAATLLDRDVNVSHIVTDAVGDRRLADARRKVKVTVHPDWPQLLTYALTQVPAIVTVKTKNGKTLTKERMYVVGSPQEPLTMQQFKDLYFKYTQGILPQAQAEKTADAILNLEKLTDLEELMDRLVFKYRI